MKVSRCKGTRDLLPQDMVRFRRAEGVFRSCCLGWGYQEVRTPTLEYLHLFTAAGTLTPGMLSRVYSFLDWNGWSGERVVLRPEGTIPAARLYVESLQEHPLARLFYVENVFAFEGSGEEPRERWQCGAELIGDAKPEADVELISLALETLEKLGVGAGEVHLSHAGVIKGLLSELEQRGEVRAELLDRVFAGDMTALAEVGGLAPEVASQLRFVFSLRGTSSAVVRNLRTLLVRSFPAVGGSLDNLALVADLLSALGHPYQVDFTSGRNFEYYTGLIFQFQGGARRLGGGGRYDELISLVGGGNVPASGFALYLDELANVAGGVEPAGAGRVVVEGEKGGAAELEACFEVGRLLREAGYVAEMGLGHVRGDNFSWRVRVVGRGKKPVFEVTRPGTEQRWRRESAAGVVSLLGEVG